MIAEDLEPLCSAFMSPGNESQIRPEDFWMLINRTSQAEAERDAAQARVKELEAQIERLTTGRTFVIKYDDTDVEDEVFVGDGAEECALYRYAQASQSWNCHLFIEVASRAAEHNTEEPPQA